MPEAEARNIVARLRDGPERDDSRYEMIEAVRYMLSLKDAQLVATKRISHALYPYDSSA